MKTILIVIGIVLILLMTMICYACLVVGSEAERQIEEWEGKNPNAGRD